MSARIIDGKAAGAAVRADVAAAVPAFVAATGRAPGLAVVLVGQDPASEIYVRSKGRATVEAGMVGQEYLLPVETSQAELLALVHRLNADETVDGILVQLPLPPQIDEGAVIQAIDPDKDVDGFHLINVGRLATGLPGPVPCTPLGCLHLLRQELGDLSGRDAVVVGRSNIVGKPMAALLVRESCTVTVAHSRTRDLPALIGRAEIVIAAIGRPRFIQAEWFRPGAIVIDVGVNRLEGRKLAGDVDFAAAVEVAGAITPVPGGVGPMTIAMLMRNTLVAASMRAGLPPPTGL